MSSLSLRFSLRSLVFVLGIAALLVGYYRAELMQVFGMTKPQFETIETFEQFEQAISKNRAVIFFDAPWSVSSAFRKKVVFLPLTEHFQDSRIRFYLASDLTAKNKAVMPFLFAWLKENGCPVPGGNGEIIWVEKSKVIKVEWGSKTLNDLEPTIQTTESVFGID